LTLFDEAVGGRGKPDGDLAGCKRTGGIGLPAEPERKIHSRRVPRRFFPAAPI